MTRKSGGTYSYLIVPTLLNKTGVDIYMDHSEFCLDTVAQGNISYSTTLAFSPYKRDLYLA